MDKIILRLAQMTVQRALTIGAIVTVVFYFMFYDGGDDLDQKISAIQAQVTTQAAKEKDSQAALKKLEQIRASIASLNEQFRLASQQLPAEVKPSDILKTIDTLARSSNVNVKTTEPLPSTKEDIVEKMPLRVRAQGTYSELTFFLYYISIMERITRTPSFTISNLSAADEALASKPGLLNFDGEIVSYRYIGKSVKPLSPEAGVKK